LIIMLAFLASIAVLAISLVFLWRRDGGRTLVGRKLLFQNGIRLRGRRRTRSGLVLSDRPGPADFLTKINVRFRGASYRGLHGRPARLVRPRVSESATHESESVMKIVAALIALCSLSVSLQAQVPDFTPQTPLIGALLHDDLAQAKRLIDAGADPNQGRFVGFPPLLLAIVRQDVALVRLMIDKGADVQFRDRTGSTALMWAAFNETGDASMIEALLEYGADFEALNHAGETALDWALRRGETPAVAALRRAGPSETTRVKVSVEKALALLQKSGAEFTRVSRCSSCHHQFLPQMALGVARTRGLTVDEAAAREQVAATVSLFETVSEEARTNRDRIPDPPIGVSYALLGLAAQHHASDKLTDALSEVVAAWQNDDGGFHALPAFRPPLESNDVTATALSVRALRIYGHDTDARVARARGWLRSATPRTTETRAMQVLGLAWADASPDEIAASRDALLSLQRQDGGWGQLPGLESDAYATGQALVALQTSGYPVSSDVYRRGVGFLLRTQFPDGSWLVRTRTFPLQPPRDSGFPHGKHQWISAAGTSWAAMALSLSMPELASTSSR
jgi:N-acyl-D-amino-acid deacylase